VESYSAYLVGGPGLVNGGEEFVPDIGDTRIGIVPALRGDYGTAWVCYISVPAPPTQARGQDKERKNHQNGQVPVSRCFSLGKLFHIYPVSLFLIGDHCLRSTVAPSIYQEGCWNRA